MDGPIRLDISGYTDLRRQPPTITGRRITLLAFVTSNGQATNTFEEYTGTVAEVNENEISFDVGTLFYRFVNLGYLETPLKLHTNYSVPIDSHRTYMWKNIDGSDVDSAIVISSPTKGGKSRRKRKRTTKKRKGRSRRVVR